MHSTVNRGSPSQWSRQCPGHWWRTTMTASRSATMDVADSSRPATRTSSAASCPVKRCVSGENAAAESRISASRPLPRLGSKGGDNLRAFQGKRTTGVPHRRWPVDKPAARQRSRGPAREAAGIWKSPSGPAAGPWEPCSSSSGTVRRIFRIFARIATYDDQRVAGQSRRTSSVIHGRCPLCMTMPSGSPWTEVVEPEMSMVIRPSAMRALVMCRSP